MRPQKNRGGNKLNILTLAAANTAVNGRGYAYLQLDVSKIKTLTIGSITTGGGASLNPNGYVNVRTIGGTSVIKSLSISNNPQIVDVTNYNAVELAIYFQTSTSAYASVRMNDITGK